MQNRNINHDSPGEDSPEQFVLEVMRYLDGLASPAEFAELQGRLADSEAHRRTFVRLCIQARAMAEGLGAWELMGSELTNESLDTQEMPDVFLELIEEAIHSREVHDIEDRANRHLAEDLRIQREEARRYRLQPEPALSGPRVIVVPTVVAYLGAGLVAALLMLTVYLIAAPDRSNSAPGTIADSRTPGAVSPGVPRFVATLTQVSSDAVWSDQSDGWFAGMKLEAGEIDLASGSIVVELNDGAEITLHGPARFSILDSNHSELHHGQLGADVPASGHGFEVLIPGGVVTDYGTTFSLLVPDSPGLGPSHLEVDKGLVTVATRRSGRRGEAVALRNDQFATIEPDGSEIRAYEYTNLTSPIDTHSTGEALRHGRVDSDWMIRINDNPRAHAAIVVAPDDWTSSEFNHLYWLPGGLHRSHWVALQANGATERFISGEGPATFTYTTTLTIPENFDPDTVTLDLRFIVDNRLNAIRVNGRAVAGPFELPHPDLSSDDQRQYRTWTSHTLKGCFVSGENTLEFVVHNYNGSSGLRVEMEGAGTQVFAPLTAPPSPG